MKRKSPYNRFFAKARPEADFKYCSNATACFSSLNAMYVFTCQVGAHYLREASGLETSRAVSMKSRQRGLSVLFFRVTTPIGILAIQAVGGMPNGGPRGRVRIFLRNWSLTFSLEYRHPI